MPIGKGEGCSAPSAPDAEPFTIVMPPPNVTGSLHIGHALDNTLQDILVRHARMQGKDALWVVGTDHAGIATQMVVERKLDSQQASSAPNYGREDFVEQGVGVEGDSGRRDHPPAPPPRRSLRLGQRALHHGRGLLAAPSSRCSSSSTSAGLLYRDKRLVNWDPKFQTAISDLEVETREVQGKFWHLQLSARRRQRARSRSRPRGPRRCSPTWRSRCIPTTSATRRWSASRSSMPITGRADPDRRRRACRSRARLGRGQDHARATTSTISRSASAPASSPATCSTCSMRQAHVVQTADGLIPAGAARPRPRSRRASAWSSCSKPKARW